MTGQQRGLTGERRHNHGMRAPIRRCRRSSARRGLLPDRSHGRLSQAPPRTPPGSPRSGGAPQSLPRDFYRERPPSPKSSSNRQGVWKPANSWLDASQPTYLNRSEMEEAHLYYYYGTGGHGGCGSQGYAASWSSTPIDSEAFRSFVSPNRPAISPRRQQHEEVRVQSPRRSPASNHSRSGK